MTEWGLERIEAERGMVVLHCRMWDGIDHPEWISIKLGPEQARKLAFRMIDEAGNAAAQQDETKSKRRADAIAKRDALNAQIAELDAVIDPASSAAK